MTNHNDLRDRIADVITYHHGNRGGTLDHRERVAAELADTLMEIIQPALDGARAEALHDGIVAITNRVQAAKAQFPGRSDSCTGMMHATEILAGLAGGES